MGNTAGLDGDSFEYKEFLHVGGFEESIEDVHKRVAEIEMDALGKGAEKSECHALAGIGLDFFLFHFLFLSLYFFLSPFGSRPLFVWLLLFQA